MELADNFGNALVINEKGNIIKIDLRLANKTVKHIGNVDIANKTFVVRRNRDKHLFKNANSYGFNYKLIKEAKRFDHVLLNDEKGSYRIPNEVILEQGSFLHFKNQGFEVQLFLSLEIINQFKVIPVI